MRIDFHSHILPGIDDGARNVEESVQLLDAMAEDGVDIVVATPHFYCNKSSIHGFLDKRTAAFEKLKRELKPEHPRIILGAEVLYNSALVGKDALTRLTIQGTNFMLLEMPYKKLTEDIIDGVEKLVDELDVKIIIAHAERYLNFTSMKSVKELMELDVLGQINAESLVHFRSKNDCFKLIKSGYIQLLGTDVHRTDRGDACLSQGLSVLEKKFGANILHDIEKAGKMVLSNRTVEEIL